MTTHRGLAWSEVTVPTELTEVVDEISYQRVVMNPGATWDYFPGHFDPRYAESHGHPNDLRQHDASRRIHRPRSRRTGRGRTAAWCGGRCRCVGSVYAGDSMVGRGRRRGQAMRRKPARPCRYLVDLEIAMFNQRDELCCPAEVTLELVV